MKRIRCNRCRAIGTWVKRSCPDCRVEIQDIHELGCGRQNDNAYTRWTRMRVIRHGRGQGIANSLTPYPFEYIWVSVEDEYAMGR